MRVARYSVPAALIPLIVVVGCTRDDPATHRQPAAPSPTSTPSTTPNSTPTPTTVPTPSATSTTVLAYWAFSPPWIAEGAADFMTTVSADKEFSSNDCSLGDSLSDLDRLYEELSESRQPTAAIKTSGCAYSLGRGLFLDLHDTLGDEAFRTGFGKLYLAMRDEELYDECTGIERGVCYVREAFVADAALEAAALASPVIDRWYHGPSDP